MKTYGLDDVVAALNQVAPRDWASFFQERVYKLTPRLPLQGLEQSGWKLIYNDNPNDLMQAAEGQYRFMDLTHPSAWCSAKAVTPAPPSATSPPACPPREPASRPA